MDNSILLLGDCLEQMKSIENSSIDLTVTSPPYDNLRTYNGNNAQWGEHVWKHVIQELFRVTKQGGVVVWVVGDATIKGSETGTSFKQALWSMECGFNLHDTMIWHKPNPIPRAHNRYENAFEFMLVFSKGKIKTWNGIKIPCKMAGNPRSGTIQQDTTGLRSAKHKGGVCSDNKISSNVWCFANWGGNKHPATFPEKLAHDHIISWSNEGDTVFDPFMGSGTTGKVAKQLNRKFIGIELEEEYFNLAKNRINAE